MKNQETTVSVANIVEKFLSFEEKNNLLKLCIDKVYPWEALRARIYYDIATKINIFDEHIIAKQTKKSIIEKTQYLVVFFYNILFKNPFFNFKKIDVLVFEHPRKVLYNGIWIDIYSHFLIDSLIRQGNQVEVYETRFNGKLFKHPYHAKSLDIFTLVYRLIRPFIKTISSIKLMELNQKMNDFFGIKYDITNRFIDTVWILKIKSFLYKLLFRLKRPKSIYVVVSYGWSDMIKAAKELNIEVIELQHGVINKYHLGYNYPKNNKDLHYFPDKLYVWGDFWKKNIDYPLEKKSIISKGFEYFDIQKKSLKLEKDKNSIIILSQGGIGEVLAGFVLENIDNLAKYTIHYKLHPSEYKTWGEYKSLVLLSKYDNVNIIDNNNKSLYYWFSKCDSQLGVFSTAIYEGLAFKCKTFILDIIGAEYMDKLIEEKSAIQLKNMKYDYDFMEINLNTDINFNQFFIESKKEN